MLTFNNVPREYVSEAFTAGGAKMQMIFYPFSDSDAPLRAFKATLEVLEFPKDTPFLCAAFTVNLGLFSSSNTKVPTETAYREHLFTKEEPRARSVKLMNHQTLQNAIQAQQVDGHGPLVLSFQVALVECGPKALGWARNPATLLKTTDPKEDRYEDALWDLPDNLDHSSIKLHDEAVLKALQEGHRSPYLQLIRRHDSISTAMPLRRPRHVINRVGLGNGSILDYKNVIIQALLSVRPFTKRLMAIEDRGNELAFIKGIFWKLVDPSNDLPASPRRISGYL